MKYLSSLDKLVTGSVRGDIVLADPHQELKRQDTKRVLSGHTKAIYGFAYSPYSKYLASCGAEREMYGYQSAVDYNSTNLTTVCYGILSRQPRRLFFRVTLPLFWL